MPGQFPDDLTCVVPTHNRPHFLRRLLTFWSNGYPQDRTIIADSSTGSARLENESLVREFSDKLPLDYSHCDLGVVDKIASAVNRVSTPYMVMAADDDFALPSAVKQSLEFLKVNPDYVCAQGMIASLKSCKSRCRLKRGYDLSTSSSVRRFKQVAELWYSTYYGVYRTKSFQECMRVALLGPRYEQARVFPEFIHSQVTVLQGKAKYFPRLYGVWQVHDENEGRKTPAIQDHAQGLEHYLHFRRVLVDQLRHYTDLDEDACREIVDDGFAALMSECDSAEVGRRNSIERLWAQIDREIRRTAARVKLQYHSWAPWQGLWQDREWQLARRLIQCYPQGMSPAEQQSELKPRDCIPRVA